MFKDILNWDYLVSWDSWGSWDYLVSWELGLIYRFCFSCFTHDYMPVYILICAYVCLIIHAYRYISMLIYLWLFWSCLSMSIHTYQSLSMHILYGVYIYNIYIMCCICSLLMPLCAYLCSPVLVDAYPRLAMTIYAPSACLCMVVLLIYYAASTFVKENIV